MVWAALVLIAGVVPAAAQDAPKPVATDNQMLHKRLVDDRGRRPQRHVSSAFDQWQGSPPEWDQRVNGYTRRWVSNYAEAAIGDGTKYAVAHSSIRIRRSTGVSARIRPAPSSRRRFSLHGTQA